MHVSLYIFTTNDELHNGARLYIIIAVETTTNGRIPQKKMQAKGQFKSE